MACQQEPARREYQTEHETDPTDVDQPVDARELSYAPYVSAKLS